MVCKHQRLIRIPDFPGDALVCAACGKPAKAIGYSNGVRDYYVPGDPFWRRQLECLKLAWLDDGNDELIQCAACDFVGTIDDFDVVGADEGNLFCNQCGAEFDSCPGESE